MKVVVTNSSIKSILRWTQRLLLAGAVSMLGYAGFVLMDGWMFQYRESRRLDHVLPGDRTSSALSAVLASAPADGLIGRIEIQSLGLSVIVSEGVDGRTLRRAAGHIPGTGLPGHPGNIGISAHRDTFFRPLRNIHRNDTITFTTQLGEYRYRVVSTRVVSPHDLAVLDASDNEVLTLVTCYPFYFIGPAPARFIVRAERITG